MLCTTVLHGGVCHRTSTPHKSGNTMKEKKIAIQSRREMLEGSGGGFTDVEYWSKRKVGRRQYAEFRSGMVALYSIGCQVFKG